MARPIKRNQGGLSGLVRKQTEAMTPPELARFKRELERELPGAIERAASKAKQDDDQKDGSK
jgi:hypothetical protein